MKDVIAKVCNFIGVLLMLIVIVVMVPLTVPKFFGYNVYAVLTGSMTPAYSVGSVIFVQKCEAEEIETGDVITFGLGTGTDNVMTHRVVEINEKSGCFITKGDANDAVDSEPVRFDRLIGKVVLCIPGMAEVSGFVNSTTGKEVAFIAFALTFCLWIVADMLAPKKQKMKEQEMMKQETKEQESMKKNKLPQRAIFLLGCALVISSGVYLGSVFLEYGKGTKEYDDLQQKVFAQKEESDTHGDEQNYETDAGESESAVYEEDLQIMQAISTLKEDNEDVIGWITFDNMKLSYPIMQREDNEYYLNHTFSGEVNSAGSIFMEAANSSDFEDMHTIIYGHNMKNLSMFGQLKKYKTEEFYEEHQFFTVYTDEHAYRYQIFAYYDIAETGDVYMIGFGPDKEYREFVNKMRRRSYYDTGLEVTEQDKVITLSTCSTEGNRFVVNAKRIETR